MDSCVLRQRSGPGELLEGDIIPRGALRERAYVRQYVGGGEADSKFRLFPNNELNDNPL